ncbi:MAG: hypothetical protein J2P46_19830, partial [Zavarzinella sp.]|nr:hypothetical protein [Zavarzinella sp.]
AARAGIAAAGGAAPRVAGSRTTRRRARRVPTLLKTTDIYYARILAYRSLVFTFTEHGRTAHLAAGAWQLDVRNDPSLAEHPPLQTCVLVLTIAGLACAALGALMCARREFHVKTPEGS